MLADLLLTPYVCFYLVSNCVEGISVKHYYASLNIHNQ